MMLPTQMSSDAANDAPAAATKLRNLQIRVAGLTWVSYASYYLTRKHFSVIKTRLESELSISAGALGAIDTAYLALYALGQFVNGALGDRLGARRMIAFGMLGSAVVSLGMGFSHSVTALLCFFGLNGLFQSTGWPNNVKAMAPWFAARSRGKVMGFWCTCYQVGGIAATALATLLLVSFGWRWALRGPAAWVALVGAAILVFLVERPEDRGLAPIDAPADDEPNSASASPSGASASSGTPTEVSEQSAGAAGAKKTSGFAAMIREPMVWSLGIAYFGLKLIRYSLLFWLPYYLGKIGYGEGTAGYLSTSFEAGGIIGAVAVGWISDKYFPGKRARLLVPMLFALAVALGIYRVVATSGIVTNAISMGLVGVLLFGPDALISGAAAQDVGGPDSAASAAGIINGIGSLGGMMQGVVTAGVTARWGWSALFVVFIVLALFSALALVPMAIREKTAPVRSPA